MLRSIPLTRTVTKASVIVGPSTTAAKRFASVKVNAAHSPSNYTSHILSGLVGGSAVVIAGYGWYHFSGTKEVVNKTHDALQTLQDFQAKVPPPGVLVNSVKSLAGPLLTSVPGAQSLLDQLQKLEDHHGPEMQKLWQETVKEVSDLTANGWDEVSTKQVTELIRRNIDRVEELTKDIASDLSDQFLNAFPQVKNAVSGSLEELKELSGKGGDDVKKVISKTYSKMKKILDEGMNENTVEEIKKLIKENMQEAKDLADKAGDLAWDKGALLAGPFLDKMPDVKKMIEEAKDLFSDASKEHGPQVKDMASDLMSQLKKISEKGVNEETIREAKTLVDKKLSEIKDLGSEGKQQPWERAAKQAEFVLKKAPELKKVVSEGVEEMKALAEKKGPKAYRIIQDTYTDIQKIANKGANKLTINEGKELMRKKLEDIKSLTDETKD